MIQDDLPTSIAGLEWTVNAYTLAFGVLLVTGGRLGDIFGRRRVFLMGGVLFAARVMSPMCTAAMIAVDQSKAGVASGILSMSRMVGGTLGVAVLGTFIGGSVSQADCVNSLGEGLLIGGFIAAACAVVACALISPELAGGAVRQAPATGEASPPAVEPAPAPEIIRA